MDERLGSQRGHAFARNVMLLAAVCGCAATVWWWTQRAPSPPTARETPTAWTREDDGRVWLAVLPFADHSERGLHPSLADGTMDAMIAHLGRVDPTTLGVVARTSAVACRNLSATEAAAVLQVAFVVDGSVRVSGDRVRVEVRLLDANDGHVLWSHGDWRSYRDLPAFHIELIAGICDALPVSLQSFDSSTLEESNSSRAYASFLEGRAQWFRSDEASLRDSVESYRAALTEDPAFAGAWGALAQSATRLAHLVPGEAHWLEESTAATEAAFRFSEDVPAAWSARGVLAFRDRWEWEEAKAAFQRTIALDPADAATRFELAFLHSALEEHDAAVVLALAARELDPRSASAGHCLATCLLHAGRLADAEAEAQRVLSFAEDDERALRVLYHAARRQEKWSEAWRLVRAFWDGDSLPDESLPRDGLAAWTQRRVEALGARPEASHLEWAGALADAGRVEDAFARWLLAVTERDFDAVFSRVDPRLDALRSHPEFERTLQQAGWGGAAPGVNADAGR